MHAALRPAVFLDRDGVLNEAIVRDGAPFAPSRAEEFVLLDDARAGCATLRSMGFALVVVTNQPDVSRRTLDLEVLDAMHRNLKAHLGVDRISVCPHTDADGCGCRKPAPGMLLDAADELGLDLENSYMIGDRWRDIEAGRRAGCSTIFIDRHYQEQRPKRADATVFGLAEAVSFIGSSLRAREETT